MCEDVLEEVLEQEDEPELETVPDSVIEESESIILEIRQTVESAVTEPISAMRLELTELRDQFREKIEYDAGKERMFNALHAEMKEYKNNFLIESIQKPLIRSLILHYDEFCRLESQYEMIMAESGQDATELMINFRDNLKNSKGQILELLYRLEVTAYAEHGEKLDRRQHKVVEVRDTADAEKDKMIAEIFKIGFYWKEQIFRPEEVAIYRYREKG